MLAMGAAVPPSGATVFVVDDDPAMRDSLRWLLQGEGLTVRTYVTAKEFLEAYDPAEPGCLVLDVQLPGMNGLALQQELSIRQIVVPTIIITAYGDVRTTQRAMRAGALDVIEKPFNDEVLLDRVRQAIDVDRRTRG
jgi:two-component system, LuxR family, response regulator FixJ